MSLNIFVQFNVSHKSNFSCGLIMFSVMFFRFEMEAIMRNGVLGTVMCLVGLQAPINCEVNWKNSKNMHHQLTERLGKTISTTQDLEYFASELSNERNFVDNLDTILIPRTVGSEGSAKVRNVS